MKKNIPKKEQELYELKKDLEKRTRTDQARSFKDQNKELSGPGAGERFDIHFEEMLLKNDYNNIKYLNDRLKDNNLTPVEYKKISDDIDQIKKIYQKENKKYMSLKKI